MRRQVVLTVSESKRLIAKGVAALGAVRRALKDGIVVIAKGSTNGYVVEEILGRRIDKRAYISGKTVPDEPERSGLGEPEPMPDVVLVNGRVDPSLDRFNAVRHMGPGDVYIKGANALDYRRKVAGILIGSATGGTIGAVLGHIVGKGIHLVIPVGLEKLVYEDIYEISRELLSPDYEGPRMIPVTGTIVTEIEALKLLAGVDAMLIAAGGIAGAEGAVRLLIEGDRERVERAMRIVESIKGEPRLLL